MSKSAIARHLILAAVTQSRLSLSACHDLVSASSDFERGARAAKTGLRRLARWEIETALLDIEDEREERRLRAVLDQAIEEALAGVAAHRPSLDWHLYLVGNAAKALGLDQPARHAIYERIAGGPKCECGEWGCRAVHQDFDLFDLWDDWSPSDLPDDDLIWTDY